MDIETAREQTFQSTPSAWRETTYRLCADKVVCISIHSLRMEGDAVRSASLRALISFQSTPSAWRETYIRTAKQKERKFQSTPSAWRETRPRTHSHSLYRISIHSLRMEGDGTGRGGNAGTAHFNPLPPHGGRRQHIRRAFRDAKFQSTPSAWRETACLCIFDNLIDISIHSLRMEGDVV